MALVEQMQKVAFRRGLSPRTIKTYSYCVRKFLRTCRKDLNHISKKDIETYLLRMLQQDKSGNTVNVTLNALKFFFEEVLKRRLTVNVSYTKTPKKLPEFLTKEEIKILFSVIGNRKHKLMVTLLYAAGLRVNELVNLKVRNFQFNENYGWVRQGKGRKDRPFILADKLKEILLQWIHDNNLSHDDWLFPGQIPGNHISTQSVRLILKQAVKEARITKKVHPHMLRHSFATHLIENGYAVTEVQPLLGHRNLETTMIYTHMAAPQLLKVKSPLDDL